MVVGKPTEFQFKIDSLTPETLSMKRLAEYLTQLARLVGEEDRVHFDRVRRGSAALVFRADFEAVPKVQARLNRAAVTEAGDEFSKPVRMLNEMLAKDNAIGNLKEARRGTVIYFPGRQAARQRLGPIYEEGTVEGILVRIGGIDHTAHALIATSEQVVSCTVTREIARNISPYLYRQPLRLVGRGKWFRDEQGAWILDDFTAISFEPLEVTPLTATFEQVAKTPDNLLRHEDAFIRWRTQRRTG